MPLARDPNTAARGLASGAVAVEFIAAVLLNLQPRARPATKDAAKGATPAKQGARSAAPPRDRPESSRSGSMAQSRRQLERVVERAPPAVRNSERWKTRVAPLLDRAKGWTDREKIDKLSRRIEYVMRRRQKIESNPRYRRLPDRHKDKLTWTTRGREIFGSGFKRVQQQALVEPAKLKVQSLPAPRRMNDVDKARQNAQEAIDRLRVQVRTKSKAFMGRGRGSQKVPDGVLDPWKTPRGPSKPRRKTKSDEIIDYMREAWEKHKPWQYKEISRDY